LPNICETFQGILERKEYRCKFQRYDEPDYINIWNVFDEWVENRDLVKSSFRYHSKIWRNVIECYQKVLSKPK